MTGLLASTAALLMLAASGAWAQTKITGKAGLKQDEANAICTVSKGLKETGRKAAALAAAVLQRQERLLQAAALSDKTARSLGARVASGLPTLEEATKTQKLTATMVEKAVTLQGVCATIAGKIDQWTDTLSAIVGKQQQGGVLCLRKDVEATSAAALKTYSTGNALTERNKAIQTNAASDDTNAGTPPADCLTPWSDVVEPEDWPTLPRPEEISFEIAGVDAGAVNNACPLTTLRTASDYPGIAKKTLLAGLWMAETYTNTASGTLTARFQWGEWSALKDLADKAKQAHSDAEEALKKHCTVNGTDICKEDSTGKAQGLIRKLLRAQAEGEAEARERETRAQSPTKEDTTQPAAQGQDD
ncbi:hypothetical protein, conserved in T. vivax, (fragment), partial [Trypanosoma vivax Y486]